MLRRRNLHPWKRFVWRLVVPLIFSFCIVLDDRRGLRPSRLLAPEGFTTDNVAADLAGLDAGGVGMSRGPPRNAASARATSFVRNLSPGQRTLANVGDVRRVVDVATGHTLTLRLQPDPTGWNTAKHFTSPRDRARAAGLVILLLRPNLLVARALAAAVILPNIGSLSNLAHWTEANLSAIVTAVFQRFSLAAGIASFGFVRARIVDVHRFEAANPRLRSDRLGALVAVVTSSAESSWS